VTRALLILANDDVRQRAAHWCAKLPTGTRVTFNAPKRTLDQSAKIWAALTDISQQLTHHGQKLPPNEWKVVFLAALKKEMRVVPGLDGTGFVPLGFSSSDLSKEEMSALIDLIHMWGAEHGVVFGDEEKAA
jgi:hypothetical protein